MRKLTTDDFINRSNIIHGLIYDYSLCNYENSKKKIQIICSIHGVFEQIPNSHLLGKGCKRCNKNRAVDVNHFLVKAISCHGERYGYDNVQYVDNKTKVKIFCFEHGDFYQTPNNHLIGQGCPVCKESKGERIIREILSNHAIVYETEKIFDGCRNKRRLPFDFFLPNSKTIIEYDGIHHFEPVWGQAAYEQTIANDKVKNIYAKQNGYKLIRIPYYKIDKIKELRDITT